MTALRVGDRVRYRPRFGDGIPTEGVVRALEVTDGHDAYGDEVEEINADIFAARRFVADLDGGGWAYGHQVDEVLPRR